MPSLAKAPVTGNAEWASLFSFANTHVNPYSSSIVAKLLASYLQFPLYQVLTRARLLQWVDWILKDDRLIREWGVSRLSEVELKDALQERG
jgi:hypothetical protein